MHKVYTVMKLCHIRTCPLSWMVFIFVLNFGTQGGSITGNDSIPNLGLGKVNSIWDGATFMEIWPFSSSLCQTCWRFRHNACVKDENGYILSNTSLNITMYLIFEICFIYGIYFVKGILHIQGNNPFLLGSAVLH